jgi:hypothetical protein
MSESIDNLSKKNGSNDYSSIMPGSIPEGMENDSPSRDGEAIPGDLDLMSLDLQSRNKRKKRTKLQSKTELDKDTCRKWVKPK